MKKIKHTFPGLKVLVAEDYEINQQFTAGLLRLMGCEVLLANDGEQTLEQWKNNDFDAIFLDVQMPKVDGYDVARKIRHKEKVGTHVVIVAVTANTLIGDQEKCIEAGMDYYMSKPVTVDDFETVLNEHFSERSVPVED